MQELLKQVNKKSLAVATGIPYRRLRAAASGAIKGLTKQEIGIIYDYYFSLAQKIYETGGLTNEYVGRHYFNWRDLEGDSGV